jgi:ABC-type sulfate transport system substrate-binding protein
MTKHSPLPWMQVELHPACILANGQLARDGFQIVADPFFSYAYAASAQRMCEANAAYIVKACNAFPDLVKALEKIAAIENKEFGPDWEEIEEARKIANDVLGRVKGAPDHG